jgi:hypothetical protein
VAKKKPQDFGLTAEQFKKITVEEPEITTKGLKASEMQAAVEEVRSLNSRCPFIADKYNTAAISTGKDARQSFPAAEVARDRAELEDLFAPEYRFVDPFGVVGTRETTIENIMSGKIRKDSFLTTAETLQIHGDTIVSTGTFKMKGSMKVTFIKSGAVRTRDIGGVYQTTHTYVRTNGKLRLVASQLTKPPEPKTFTHGPDEEQPKGR